MKLTRALVELRPQVSCAAPGLRDVCTPRVSRNTPGPARRSLKTMQKPIAAFPPNRPAQGYAVRLKSMYFEVKQVHNFAKGVGRFLDHTGAPIWFELTGQTPQDVLTKGRLYLAGKAGTFTNVTVQSSRYYSGGRVINLNPKTQVRCAVLTGAEASQMPSGPVAPNGSLNDVLHCNNGDRVDVLGLVVEQKALAATNKVEVWLKDEENGKSILVELWGDTFYKMSKASHGASGEDGGTGLRWADPVVLQVENARVVKKESGLDHLTAEFFKDSQNGSAWAHFQPTHAKAQRLRSRSATVGERMSEVWAPSGAVLRMQCSSQPLYKTCLRTLKTCSVTWAEGPPSTVGDGVAMEASTGAPVSGGRPLPAEMQVEVHGVWLTGVSNPDPVYTKCKHCRTKIDSQGNCKNYTKHLTEPDSSKAALSSVSLGDFGAGMDDILADEQSLVALAGVRDVEELEQLVQQRTVAGMCFRVRCDVVLGANREKAAKPSLAKRGRPADAPNERNFSILKVTPLLMGALGTPQRPALKQVLSLVADHGAGAVLPVADLATGLAATLSSVKCELTGCAAECVMILGRAQREPTRADLGDMEEITHERVVSTVWVGDGDPAPFRVEMLAPKEEEDVEGAATNAAPMQEEDVDYLIVGRPQGSERQWTLMAENIFSCKDIPEVRGMFKKELESCRELLVSKTTSHAQKRPAKELITETPTKVRCVQGAADSSDGA